MVYDAARKVRPVVEDPLDAFATAIEEGVDPLEAHGRAFGGATAVEEDPAERYTRLLEAGYAPDRAYRRAYPGRMGFVLDEEIVYSPPEILFLDATSARQVEGTESNEDYTSYVYKVQYPSVDEERDPLTTWVRVDIPNGNLATFNRLGVVLLVEGSAAPDKGVWPRDEGTGEGGEEAEDWYETRSRLASGKKFSEERSLDADSRYPYRDGSPMIVVSFTQPGRGPGDWAATGDPVYDDDTPFNQEGRDYWGETTLQAMDAVVAVVDEIIEDIRATFGESIQTRLVLLSTSAGLIAASGWISTRGYQVHALVDSEGPSDGTEASGAEWAWDLSDLDGLDTFDLPVDLSWFDWMAWATSMLDEAVDMENTFTFWYRPPVVVVQDPALGEGADAFCTLLKTNENTHDTGSRWFNTLEDPGIGPIVFRSDMEEFWAYREPYRNLAGVMATGAAYVRIQGNTNHAPHPPNYNCRNAVRNLHAAWTASGGTRVYYADEGYREGVQSEYEGSGYISIDPTEMTSDPDPDTFSSSWPKWPGGKEIIFFTARGVDGIPGPEWQIQVDMVRWAVMKDF